MPRVNPPDVDRVAASRAAVAARRARAKVKDAVAQRRRSALDVLATGWVSSSSAEARLRVRELLSSVPGIGPVRSSKILAELGISDSKRVGGLGRRQREAIRAWLERRERHIPPIHALRADHSRLVVLAGPTAVGKGAVSRYIREHYPDVLLSVSATTRAPRPGEVDGVDYRFVSDAEFDRLIASDAMLESAVVHNAYRYGTPRAPIEAALAEGKSVLLEIDLQGARSVRAAMPGATLVFLLPPSWEELVRRLIGRGTEDSAEQSRRLETAKIELGAQNEFDYRVVNDDVSRAAQEVVDLMSIPDEHKEHNHG
ncbi:MAG: guanylate kinase [Cryobacterium sp.]|jgi:guanylate kinase|nr:guanylate kinase [Cryobacterium sp.]